MRLLQRTWFRKKEKKKIRGYKTIHTFTKRTEDKANDKKNTNNGNNNDISINNDNNNNILLIIIIIIIMMIIIIIKQKTLNRRTQ